MKQGLISGPKAKHDASRVGAGLSRGPNTRRKYNAAPWSGTWPAPGSTLDLDFANNRGWVRGVGQGGVMDAITFTRASNATYVDSAGVLQTAANNAPRFDWAGTAVVAQKNLLRFTEEFDNAVWIKRGLNAFGGGSVANTLNTLDPFGKNTAEFIQESTENIAHAIAHPFSVRTGDLLTFSIYIKSAGRNYVSISGTSYNSPAEIWWATYNLIEGTIIKNLNVEASLENIGNGWWRLIYTYVAPYTIPGDNRFGFWVSMSDTFDIQSQSVQYGKVYTGDGASGIYIWGAQLELGNTATPYIANGAFPPTNTPLRPTTTTCNGILIEESRQNRMLWCRDATQTNWTCTNVTPLKDQTGIDGVANAASSLTASADGGTCIQTITLTSGSRTGSVYLKRLTGTGTVQVSLDGSTWSTVDLSADEWRRIVLSGTVTNPTVGIKLATNGDALAMDFGQIEDGAFVTSPILTTTAGATRSADVASMSGSSFFGWYQQQKGTIVTSFICYSGPPSTARFSLEIGVSAARTTQYINNSTTLRSDVSGGNYTDVIVPATVGTKIRTAFAFQNNNFSAYASNGKLTKSFGGQVPLAQIAYIGNFNNGQNLLNGAIERIIYIPRCAHDSSVIAFIEST